MEAKQIRKSDPKVSTKAKKKTSKTSSQSKTTTAKPDRKTTAKKKAAAKKKHKFKNGDNQFPVVDIGRPTCGSAVTFGIRPPGDESSMNVHEKAEHHLKPSLQTGPPMSQDEILCVPQMEQAKAVLRKSKGRCCSLFADTPEKGFRVCPARACTMLGRTEQALLKSEERLRLAAEAAHFGTYDADLVHNTFYWSPEMKKILGLAQNAPSPLPRKVPDFIHPEDKEKVKKLLDRCHDPAGDGQVYHEHRIIRPDGTVRWVFVKGAVEFEGEGNNRRPVRSNGILLDITELKETELKLRKAKDELELRVQERTKQLAAVISGLELEVRQRKQAEIEIRKNQQTLRELAAELQLVEQRERRQIAQDLHDSICQILAFSTRSLKELLKSLPEKEGDIIREIASHLESATDQTRTLSFDLSPGTLYHFGFEPAVEELVEKFSEQRNIKCQFENCDTPKPLTDDVKVLLYRSIRELLINAAKHAQANSITVSLLRSKSDIYVKVQDDGKGFDYSILNASSRKNKGFGLLSIHERLNHIGGQLKFESAVGKGTTAVLIAPLNIDDEESSV